MTDLQASLFVIGGVIVVGVIAYNKWQEHKAKKSVERAFSYSHDDVLMGASSAPQPAAGERQEPHFAQHDVDAAERELNDQDMSLEASGDAAFEEAAPVESLNLAEEKELPVDYLIDCTIPLTLTAQLRGEKVLAATQSLRSVGGKPIHFVGQRVDGGWEAITHGSVYKSLTAGVQLANRNNALNELEYSEFVMRLRQIADDFDADPDVPDMTEVMVTARSLHHFVAEHDAKLGINVQSKGAPWSVSTLLSALERQGFDVRPEGRLVMPDGEGGVLFSLSTNVTLAEETTNRLTLLLDVPVVLPARDGFGAMVACARSLAARLDGAVVDDSGQPLSDESLTEIAGQIDAFYADMETSDIPAGSTRALRLFN
ncbi:MAG: cell division protein ZipA C-terminal FtsZ-binding domain-containing protein [Oxalicibacterium faecigallinarum]|uniref:cell division protein ZipA C-terminal FtsZ-binding domain-containing protein n=1 Tax=Oxalicibacterium faecigallinarum TaxID=573741 RepID=UPI002809FE11|nr:cell division protein ZipA C-terminal FtsZ-binding domain-containing protein [Oxalicibacterium faecigallinarum]MDQ7969494.1 cell division protein ZipA C-terminal FtsZ-binding domain-containing protein [Oxalicibacterium faecigallinarum]